MEEHVIGADDQALQYMLTESHWDSQAVMDQVAQEANLLLGGDESCLLLDESGFEKKGEHSVGVARQWNGRLGKVDNCQVGVFAALGRGTRATLIDYRHYLPERWSEDVPRCKKMGIPESFCQFKTKSELALEMVRHQRQQGIQFAWVGADGGYGKEPAFLRGLDDMDEIFVVDVHKDQLIYLEDPEPVIPQRKNNPRGRKTSRYQAQTQPVRVDNWKEAQPEEAWRRYKLRDSTKGELIVEILHKRVWLWDKKRPTHTTGICLYAGNSIHRKPANIAYPMRPQKLARNSLRKCRDSAIGSNAPLKMVKVSQEWPIIRLESGNRGTITWLWFQWPCYLWLKNGSVIRKRFHC